MSTKTKTPPLIAFHGDANIKEKYLTRLRAHRAADNIIQGTGWERGKGCAVGCTLENYNHKAYEKELGIPQILARLEDRIFEGLPNADAKEFPIQFLDAIPVGADLTKVWRHYMIWLLIDTTSGVIRFAKTEAVKGAINLVADMFTRSLIADIPLDELRTIRDQVWEVRRAAYADAAYAAAAAYAADAYADAARDTARKAHYGKQRDKLLELLRAAK